MQKVSDLKGIKYSKPGFVSCYLILILKHWTGAGISEFRNAFAERAFSEQPEGKYSVLIYPLYVLPHF